MNDSLIASQTPPPKKVTATSTVGRKRTVTFEKTPCTNRWENESVKLFWGDSLSFYNEWAAPTVIVSDGAYGVLGFDGDTSDHLDMPEWYEAHVEAWSRYATPQTTLWFWNSEVGWASVHPVLERYGWRYVNANIWNKGKAHIAGNVNTAKIRRFPVVTEMCVQYSLEPRIQNMSLKQWLHSEWKRTGLPFRKANEACGVKDVAVRKYLDQGHLWYAPPPDMFERMATYANIHGTPSGRPFFSRDGAAPMTAEDWAAMRAKFRCPMGFTNVWDRNPLKGNERIKVPELSGKAAHLNQKPLDLMRLIIEASSNLHDVIWEPFGGLFSAALAAQQIQRRAFAAETDATYFQLGITRFQGSTTLQENLF